MTPVSPRPPAPVYSEFYERKRRLAIIFAGLSVGLMLVSLSIGSFFWEVYTEPRAAWNGESVYALHRSITVGEGNEPGARLLVLNDALAVQVPTRRLVGGAGGFVVEGEEVTAYFGMQASVIRGGNTVRSARLEQNWEVRAAAHDTARKTSWIFGWREGKIVSRRRELGTYSEAIPVADAADVERVTASIVPASGPLVAWQERGSARIKTVQFDGASFRPGAEFDLQGARHWDVVPWGERTILVTYQREDRRFREVVFRVRCCEGCRKQPLPSRVGFEDPILFGKMVTGLAATTAGDRLVIVATRPMTIQAAAAPLPSLRPEGGAGRLVPIGQEPLWRVIMGALFPSLMLFFSFSLVFLGFTLLRERSGFILERLTPVPKEGPEPAEILQRAMANILDLMVLLLPFALAVEVLNVSPESADLDFSDPKLLAMLGVWAAFHFLYHFGMEWGLGWTIGKRILGIRVTELDGSRLTLRGALLRNLVRILDAEYPLGVFLGTSVMMATGRRQRLGDLAARTMVVRETAGENRLQSSAPRL